MGNTGASKVEVAVVGAAPTASLRLDMEPHAFASRYILNYWKFRLTVFLTALYGSRQETYLLAQSIIVSGGTFTAFREFIYFC